ncbi:hypothetical protein [Romboutsia sp.]|uniref:hypothetical protein n=1 Tax=Romboutsia sp. TaxID=1965302 RepID=UPI002C7EE430|nr:hypothetical protein [Romboutsia sp.]HSQ88142.1 hypothetical protein [Romboutsia sp.]
MKYVGLLVSSIGVFLVILANFYYNSVTLDMQKIRDYVVESNIILEDVVKKEEHVIEKKDEYISRLITLKKGINNSKTTFLISDYKEYKIKSIDSLMQSISECENNKIHLEEVNKYNELCDEEVDKLIINKSFI